MSHKDITIKIKELKKKKLSAETQLKFLSADLDEVNRKLEELESQAWFLGDDERELDGVMVACNHDSWEAAKRYGEAPFYVAEPDGNYVIFSLKDAKELIKYMQEKIDYLESED